REVYEECAVVVFKGAAAAAELADRQGNSNHKRTERGDADQSGFAHELAIHVVRFDLAAGRLAPHAGAAAGKRILLQQFPALDQAFNTPLPRHLRVLRANIGINHRFKASLQALWQRGEGGTREERAEGNEPHAPATLQTGDKSPDEETQKRRPRPGEQNA